MLWIRSIDSIENKNIFYIEGIHFHFNSSFNPAPPQVYFPESIFWKFGSAEINFIDGIYILKLGLKTLITFEEKIKKVLEIP